MQDITAGELGNREESNPAGPSQLYTGLGRGIGTDLAPFDPSR